MGIYLGMDVGGSRSRWAWLDMEAEEKPEGIQAAIRGTRGAAQALARLLGEISSAHPDRKPDLTVIGIAGAGDRTAAAEIEDGLRRLGVSWPLRVVGDVVVAASASLSEGPGVGVWSGTGSFAVARDSVGELHRVGGRGYLLGDSGSAYDMVRRAGVAAVRSLDGMGPETGLLEALVRAASPPSPSELGRVMQRWDPERVAGCFPAILTIAQQGDEVAEAVLRRGARDLARLAVGAVRRGGLDPATVELFLGGGVLERQGRFGDLLSEELSDAGLAGQPRTVGGGAARGGALLARALHLGEEPMCSWVEARGTS